MYNFLTQENPNADWGTLVFSFVSSLERETNGLLGIMIFLFFICTFTYATAIAVLGIIRPDYTSFKKHTATGMILGAYTAEISFLIGIITAIWNDYFHLIYLPLIYSNAFGLDTRLMDTTRFELGFWGAFLGGGLIALSFFLICKFLLVENKQKSENLSSF